MGYNAKGLLVLRSYFDGDSAITWKREAVYTTFIQ